MKFLGDIDTRDIVLLDVKYVKHRTGEEDSTDYAMLLFKNVRTGLKFVHNIPNPKVEIFFVKPEYRDFTHNLTAIEMDKLYSKVVPYKDVIKTIADEAGGKWKEFRSQCIQQRNYRAINNLFHYQYSFGADLDICDFYRCWWTIHYYHPETKIVLKKAFLDIENDVVDYIGMPEKGKAPVNAVSVCDGFGKKVHTFCLKNAARPNPLIQEFENDIDNFYKLCHETYDEEFPGFQYQIYTFDDELKMLYKLFEVIRMIDPDTLGIWNMGYDVQNLIARAYELGGDAHELFCDPEFKLEKLNYWEDKNVGKPVLKKDFFDVTSKIVWMDAMLNYGKLRKNRAQLRSSKLDYIAKTEIGSGKFEYSGSYDKFLPYTNYQKFILYSIKDVLLLYGIESKTEDMDDVLSRATVNGSSYKEVFSQTKFLKNRFYIECLKQGYVAGNNSNMDYTKPFDADEDNETGFDGALVADPELNEHVGAEIFGRQSKYVFNYVVDMDFSALYPNTIISFNISAKTMLGKLLIENEYYKGNARDVYEEDPNLRFECGKEFLENYLAKDPVRMGMNWFGLPSVEEMLDELETTKPRPKRIRIDNNYSDFEKAVVRME